MCLLVKMLPVACLDRTEDGQNGKHQSQVLSAAARWRCRSKDSLLPQAVPLRALASVPRRLLAGQQSLHPNHSLLGAGSSHIAVLTSGCTVKAAATYNRWRQAGNKACTPNAANCS